MDNRMRRVLKKIHLYSVMSRTYLWARDRVIGPFQSMVGIPLLKKKISECRDAEDYVNFALSFKIPPLLTIRPSQIKEEITELLKLLIKIQPRVICEVGTGWGGTLFLFSRCCKQNAMLISIDLPESLGGSSGWRIPIYKSLVRPNQKLYLVRGDSRDFSAIHEVKRVLGKRKIDFLFIDGDHTYESVKADFENFGPFVKPNGIVAFHDIVPGPPRRVGGVPRFWKEIRKNFRYQQIVKDWKQGGWGIGIIYVNSRGLSSYLTHPQS